MKCSFKMVLSKLLRCLGPVSALYMVIFAMVCLTFYVSFLQSNRCYINTQLEVGKWKNIVIVQIEICFHIKKRS